MAIRVGRWDCEHCGHKGVLGPKTKCSKCGAARPEGVRFYLPKDARIVRDPEEIKEAKSGANWDCSFCGSDNEAKRTTCIGCGNPRTAKEERLEIREYGLDEVPRGSEERKGIEEKDKSEERKSTLLDNLDKYKELGTSLDDHLDEVEEVEPIISDDLKEPEKTVKGFSWSRLPLFQRFLIIGIPSFILFVIFLILLFSRNEFEVSIDNFQWQRKILTEEYQEVEKEGWTVPSDGEVIREFEAIHHYEKVPDGYETRTKEVKKKVGTEEYVCGQRDLGNGYFEDTYCSRPIYENVIEEYEVQKYREDPVYRTKYEYTVWRWRSSTTIKTEAYNKRPYWGDVSHFASDPHKRERGRREVYRIITKDEKGKLYKEKISFSRWKRFELGERHIAEKNGFGHYLGIKEKRK